MPITLEELDAKQKAMTERAQTMIEMTDTDQILALGAELEREGAELQAMAQAFEAQETAAQTPQQPSGGTVVVLTPAQRERVKLETGIDMEQVVLADETGLVAKMMPNTAPKTIELRALEAARRQAAAHYAEQQARIEMFQHLAEIEATSPEAAEVLAKLKEDPHFLGGLLQKK